MDGLADYDYELPPERIAQAPSSRRDESRLLVLHRQSGRIEHRVFGAIGEWLRSGDVLVINETRVFPARLRARRPTGGRMEILLLEEAEPEGAWAALVRPARSFRPASEATLEPGDPAAAAAGPDPGRTVVRSLRREGEATIVELLESGRRLGRAEVLQLCDRVGETPLPPYIRRPEGEAHAPPDRERYQTVYARHVGAVAAPTAGLHFTDELLQALRRSGVITVGITLHVGIGTFRPLDEDGLRADSLHSEPMEIDEIAGTEILRARREGRRVVAVGTTSLRAVETLLARGTTSFRGRTDIFIKPGYTFRGVDALVTNFHLPRTSLLLLVCAFAGRERTLAAYGEAIREGYRFYSYGDAMLLL